MNVPLTLNNDIPEPNFYQMNDYKQVTNQSTCLGCLGTLVGIQIQQQNDSASIIQDFRRPNVYNIYATNCCGQPISLLPLFKSKERSLGFSFLIFGGQLQPLDLFVGNFGCKVGQPINNQQKSDFLSPNRLFLRLERKWQFSCACFNRPRLNVFYIENGQNKLLGYIEIPLFFISIGCKIFDGDGNLKYKIQQRFMGESTKVSPFPWSERSTQIYFDIKDARDQEISLMRKQTKSRFNFDLSVNFSVIFPQNASVQEKALILAATLMFENMYCLQKQKYIYFLNLY